MNTENGHKTNGNGYHSADETQEDKWERRDRERRDYAAQKFDALAAQVERYFLECIPDFDIDPPDGKDLLIQALELCSPDYREREHELYDWLSVDEKKRGFLADADQLTCVLLSRSDIAFSLGFLMAARHFGINAEKFKDVIMNKLDRHFDCLICETRRKRAKSKTDGEAIEERTL